MIVWGICEPGENVLQTCLRTRSQMQDLMTSPQTPAESLPIPTDVGQKLHAFQDEKHETPALPFVQEGRHNTCSAVWYHNEEKDALQRRRVGRTCSREEHSDRQSER